MEDWGISIMNWKNIKYLRNDSALSGYSGDHFLVTDGDDIYCGYIDKDEFYFHCDPSENYAEIECRLTNYCLFKDVDRPVNAD